MSNTDLGIGKRRRMRDQLQHARDTRQYLRLLAVLECDRGALVGTVAESLGVNRQSVHNWIGRARK